MGWNLTKGTTYGQEMVIETRENQGRADYATNVTERKHLLLGFFS